MVNEMAQAHFGRAAKKPLTCSPQGPLTVDTGAMQRLTTLCVLLAATPVSGEDPLQPTRCAAEGAPCGCSDCWVPPCCGGLTCLDPAGGGAKVCLDDSPRLAAAAAQLRGGGRADASDATTEVAAETQVQPSGLASVAKGLGAVVVGMTANETEATTLGATRGCWADHDTLRVCGTQCYSSDSRSSCISGCLWGKGVGRSCSSCLGHKSDCSIARCLNPCAASDTGSECRHCVRSHCQSCR